MSTDVVTQAPAAAPPRDDWGRHKRDGIVLLVCAMAALLAAGLILDSVTSASRHTQSRKTAAPTAVRAPGAHDDFARADSVRSLGVAPSGQTWQAAGGIWGVSGAAAAVTRAAPGVSIATVSVGIQNGTVSVTAARVAPGIGLAFRCRGPLNCWRVEAVPQLGTWNVVKVIGGREHVVGNLGTVPVADGTVVQVDMNGDRLTFSIDGTRVRTIRDAALDTETRAGLSLREPASAATARWTHFGMVPRAQPGLVTAAGARVADSFERTGAARRGLDAAPTGQVWRASAGTWAVRDGEAALARAAHRGASLATVDTGSANGIVQATFMVPQNGSGLVFRCRDADNCWHVDAVPVFSTWDVWKVVDGKATHEGNLGVVPYGPGTTISVQMQGAHLGFAVNGVLVRTLDDDSLSHETAAGLYAGIDKFATSARWSQFLFSTRVPR